MNKEAIKQALQYIEANAETKDEWEIVASLREAIAEADKQNEPVLVTVKEFVKLVEGKENILGRPVYWTQWPYENTKPQPQAETQDEHEIAEGLRQAIAEIEKQERNFCSRCGKKLNKNNWDIHTCTPPLKQEQDNAK
jgi:hypothetical protein